MLRFRVHFFHICQNSETSNFHKVVRQHNEGVVESIICVMLEIYMAFQQRKNFENWLRIDKVIVMSLVYYFFGTQWICLTGGNKGACNNLLAYRLVLFISTTLLVFILFSKVN